MSLTHKALSAMGIEPEKIEQILEMHRETIDSIKADKDKAVEESKKYKADADRLADVEKELKDYKAKESQPDAFKEKYEKIKKEYETYKGEITAKETKEAKSKAYRDILKDIGVSEKRYDAILKIADLDSFELDENGAIKDAEKLKASAKNEWSEFIVSEGKAGAKTPTPPSNTGGNTMTKQQILDIKDPIARHKAMAENMEVFGIGKE